METTKIKGSIRAPSNSILKKHIEKRKAEENKPLYIPFIKEESKIIMTKSDLYNKLFYTKEIISTLIIFFLVASLSIILRTKGIIDLFNTNEYLTVFSVSIFVLIEVVLANAIMNIQLESKIKNVSKNIAVFVFQASLIFSAAIFEFSALSNLLTNNINSSAIIEKEELIIKNSLVDIEKQINQNSLIIDNNKTSDVMKRTYTKRNEELTYTKNNLSKSLVEMYNNKGKSTEIIKGNSLKNSADIIGINEDTLKKIITLLLVVMLTLGYLSALYSFFYYANKNTESKLPK